MSAQMSAQPALHPRATPAASQGVGCFASSAMPARPSCRARQARCILPAPARSRLPPAPVRGGMLPGRLPAGLVRRLPAGLAWAPASRLSRPCRPADTPAFGVHRAQAELRGRFSPCAQAFANQRRASPSSCPSSCLMPGLMSGLTPRPWEGGTSRLNAQPHRRLPPVPSLPKPLRRPLDGKSRLHGALAHQAGQHGRVRLEQVLHALSSLQAERRLGRG